MFSFTFDSAPEYDFQPILNGLKEELDPVSVLLERPDFAQLSKDYRTYDLRSSVQNMSREASYFEKQMKIGDFVLLYLWTVMNRTIRAVKPWYKFIELRETSFTYLKDVKLTLPCGVRATARHLYRDISKFMARHFHEENAVHIYFNIPPSAYTNRLVTCCRTDLEKRECMSMYEKGAKWANKKAHYIINIEKKTNFQIIFELKEIIFRHVFWRLFKISAIVGICFISSLLFLVVLKTLVKIL